MTTKTKFIIAFVVVFGFGVMVGSTGEPETKIVEKEVPKIVEKEVPAEKTYKHELKQLKKLDDKIIDTSQEAIYMCSDGFGAISRGDAKELRETTQQMEELTPVMVNLMQQRQEFINANEL